MHGPTAVEPTGPVHYGMLIQGNFTGVQLVVMLPDKRATSNTNGSSLQPHAQIYICKQALLARELQNKIIKENS